MVHTHLNLNSSFNEFKIIIKVMGCTDSSQVIENKNKNRPAFNMVENASFIEGEDLYIMGSIDDHQYVFATITASRIPATIMNPNAKSPVSLKDPPRILQKPIAPQQSKQYYQQLQTYKAWNFSQMIRIPENTNKYIKDDNGWYCISGGINYKLSQITGQCVLYNSKHHLVQKLPQLNQPRYTHCSLIFQGFIYVIGGRYFGDDDSAIISKCQRLSISEYCPRIFQQEQGQTEQHKWVEIAEMNVPRCTFFGLVHQKKIWVIGGYTGDCERSVVLEYYEPGKNNKWQKIEVGLPFGIQSVIPLVTNKNQITIFGGNSDSGPMDTVLTLNVFEKNIKANRKLKSKRVLHKSSYSPANKAVFLFGGNQSLDVQMYKLQNQMEEEEAEIQKSTVLDINLKKYFKSQEHFESLTYSSSTNYLAYSPLSSLPAEYLPSQTDEIVYILGTSYEPFILELNISVPYALYHPIPLQIQMHALQGGIYLKKNMFMILGGITDTMEQVSSRVFVYDARNKKGRQSQSLINSRYAFTYEKVGNYIYAIGGGTSDIDGSLIILNKAERLNIQSDIYQTKWEQIADLPQGLISGMSLNFKQNLYVFGGMKKSNERNNKIFKYELTNTWKQLKFVLPFGLQASSIYKNSECEFYIFGGRVVNGDSKGIWSLTFIQDGEDCVFSEKGEMNEPKCLHKTYRPKKQNFFVVFGGEKHPLSYYDCETLQTIQTDILIGMKQMFLRSLYNLEQRSLKNYLIVSKQ